MVPTGAAGGRKRGEGQSFLSEAEYLRRKATANEVGAISIVATETDIAQHLSHISVVGKNITIASRLSGFESEDKLQGE